MEILDQPGSLWRLSLIVLTMAIHAATVVMLAFVGVRVWVRRQFSAPKAKLPPSFAQGLSKGLWS